MAPSPKINVNFNSYPFKIKDNLLASSSTDTLVQYENYKIVQTKSKIIDKFWANCNIGFLNN